ncbi:MAG: hypothetical protein JXQ65_15550 [Candidatus Marinimicrobia bacterium]|nr:hypothetical protein [Candidatus Neomarinimicrobiota bacterium]
MKNQINSFSIEFLSRVNDFGNHHQKYLVYIEKHFDTLFSLIEEKRSLDQTRLHRFSNNPEKGMRQIASYLSDEETVLDLLGCYYAIQFLMLNFKAVDVLNLKLSITSTNKYNVFHSFLSRTGDDFRLLSGAYMKVLLDIFLEGKTPPPYVVCGVGTKVDQDDIDLGVIDRGKEGRNMLTRAFAKLNREMLKHASPLHFHISEHVGEYGYSAAIPEYHDLLDKKITSFVLISEMLNAVPFIGDFSIYDEFKTEIIDRYFYRENLDNKYHEGYLRGLLGEMNDLIMRKPEENILNPKKDALRLLKAVVFALRTWKGVNEKTSLDALTVLIGAMPELKDDLYNLYRSFTFIETFRFLYQLFVVQEEEICLEEDGMLENLQKVSFYMGYENTFYADAVTQMLIHYQDHVKLSQYNSRRILKHITKHLSKITVFSYFNSEKKDNSLQNKNLPQEFIKSIRFFSGTRFWDDILLSMDRNESTILEQFIEDLKKLSKDDLQKVYAAYVKWGARSPYTLISLFNSIKDKNPLFIENQICQDFMACFIYNIKSRLQDIGNFGKVLDYYPKKMYNFISMLNDDLVRYLLDILNLPIIDAEVNRSRKKLLALCKLHYNSSYFFKRFLYRVFNTYQNFLIDFTNPTKFRKITEGLLGNIDNFSSIDERIEKLNSYYDFEFMRLGINAISGTFFGVINREFTIFSDNYLQILFELCREQVLNKHEKRPVTRDLLALYTAGGHARSQAFDDDYDLIILLNSNDRDIINFANEIVMQMNKHIIRRSIMPHYKFADRFRNYITTFDQLIELFENPDENVFIEKSQLLGSRMIVGNTHFTQAFHDKIVFPYIFDQRDFFIKQLLEEMSSRNSFHHPDPPVDIKESPGGLRDLENFLFILKAYYKIPDPISTKLFTVISNKVKEKEEQFNQLFMDYYFLKYIRDLYHIMVSDDDLLQTKYLETILEPISKSRREKIDTAQNLETRIFQAMKNNEDNIKDILLFLKILK